MEKSNQARHEEYDSQYNTTKQQIRQKNAFLFLLLRGGNVYIFLDRLYIPKNRISSGYI
jgi:hypothetical protein